jgi:hypothetical protein
MLTFHDLAPAIDPGPIRIGVLHIGKTGGTALKAAIRAQRQRAPRRDIHCFGHEMTLPDLLERFPAARAVAFVRDPAARFVSGFNSRLREEEPAYHVPWTAAEAEAFARFPTAGALAEALSDPDAAARAAAEAAMRDIHHVNSGMARYLVSPEFLEAARDRLLWIGSQETFAADFAVLGGLLGLDADLGPPEDDVAAHRTPARFDRHLSHRALANLRDWYAMDYRIDGWCRAFRGERLAARPAARRAEAGPAQE